MHQRSFFVIVIGFGLVVVSGAVLANPGDLYVTNFGQDLLKFAPNGTQSTYASGFNTSNGIAFDSSGNLFVSNGQNPAEILKFTPSGSQSTFTSGLNNVFGMAFGATGNLFVTSNPSVIYEFAPDGTRTTFASGLNGPYGLAFDHSGNLFVADRGSGSILEFTPGGSETMFATGLDNPSYLAFDSAGNLWMTQYTDASNPDGGLYEFASNGTKTFIVGMAFAAGLAFNGAGTLFVADGGNQIVELMPDHTLMTFASGINNPAYLAFEGQTLPVPEPSMDTLLVFGAGIGSAWLSRRRC
jgi:sugar lactone lactonase YvrE